MNVSTTLRIRQIANGYVVSSEGDEYFLGINPRPDEQFFPTLDAVVMEAGSLVRAAVEASAAASEKHAEQLAREEQMMARDTAFQQRAIHQGRVSARLGG
jgi:hypothetical protein